MPSGKEAENPNINFDTKPFFSSQSQPAPPDPSHVPISTETAASIPGLETTMPYAHPPQSTSYLT